MSASDHAERYSRAGLLRRYARGRVAHFGNRQSLTAFGSIVLALVNGPMAGLTAALLALIGEGVDILVLRRVPALIDRHVPLARLDWITTASAGFQAATIAACVGLGWYGDGSREEPFFALAFLAGAAINAGLTWPFHRSAAMARLSVYGATVVGFFVHDALWLDRPPNWYLLDAGGALILAYMVYAFLHFVVAGFNRSRKDTLELLRQSHALERANTDLRAHQKEAHRLSLVAKNANDSVVLTDADGRILWTNQAFSHITGWTQQEAVNRHPGELLNGPDTDPATVAAIARSLKACRPFRGQICNVTKGGNAIWLDVNLVPVPGEDGAPEIVIAIERDITEARRHARELEAARLAAEDAARAKAAFLATMSHEIRTPMNGVVGMADLLAETALSEEQRDYADTIRSSAQALLTIINDILDFSKLEAEKMELSPVVFDLRACLKGVLHLMQPQAVEKGLDLDLDLQAGVPACVVGDDGRLRQILLNLIGNAIKFTERGGVMVRVSARPDGEDVHLQIDVTDSGIGIDPEKLEDVFDSFAQADGATTRRFGGTGLGLAISRRLARAMGGDISASSAPRRGSTFTLSINVGAVTDRTSPDPVPMGAEARGAGTRPDGPEPALLPDALSGLRVLVAEDNRVNRMLIDRFLAGSEIELSFAHDGQQAVQNCTRDRPDLVLMDMSMPVMNGLDATRAIRTGAGPQPRIVALTANAFDSDKEACLNAGMDGFLTKPIRKTDLLACIARQTGRA